MADETQRPKDLKRRTKGIIPGSRLSGLKGEISELRAIFVTLIKRARRADNENSKSQN